MAVSSDRIADTNLEGLVLRDGSGAYYEVPCIVIERYRVPVERATDLVNDAADGTRRVAPDWVVHDGIYTAAECDPCSFLRSQRDTRSHGDAPGSKASC